MCKVSRQNDPRWAGGSLVWEVAQVKTHLRSTSPEKKIWWQTPHSAEFGNWVSIKGLLSQKEMCHVAKSSFYDAVCLVSLELSLQDFSRVKENITESVDVLTASRGVKAVTSLGELLCSWVQAGGRAVVISPLVKRKTHSKHQRHGGFTDRTMLQDRKTTGAILCCPINLKETRAYSSRTLLNLNNILTQMSITWA